MTWDFSAIYFEQLFGLFPVSVVPDDPSKVNFKWKSIRAMFSLFTIFSSATTGLFVLKNQLDLGPLTARNVIGVIFFGICCLIAILSFRTAMRWRMLMIQWMKTEWPLTNEDYRLNPNSWSLKKRVLTCTIAYLSLSIFEHACFLASDIYKLHLDIVSCNRTDIDPVELFITRHLGFVIDNLPWRYNHFLGFFLEYLNISYTFYWNFIDLFIIVMYWYRLLVRANKRQATEHQGINGWRRCVGGNQAAPFSGVRTSSNSEWKHKWDDNRGLF